MLLAVALLAASSSAWLPASGALPAARARPLTARRAACSTINMQMNLQNLTLTLTGCSNGVGVGLDEDNKVDMLRPGMPASKVLLVGDKVISWNDLPMVEVSGGRVVQRKLKDVVTPADSSTPWRLLERCGDVARRRLALVALAFGAAATLAGVFGDGIVVRNYVTGFSTRHDMLDARYSLSSCWAATVQTTHMGRQNRALATIAMLLAQEW